MARISKAGGEKTKAKARKAGPAKGRKTAKPNGRKTQVAAPRKGRPIVELTKELDKALARQDATAEILKVISASPTDVKSVFDAICATAARLFNCDLTGVFWIEGASLTAVTGAFADRLFEQHEHAPDMPLAADHNFPAMAAVERRTVHVPNYLATQLPAHEQYISDRYGIKCGLYLPLLRNGECIGVFLLTASKPDHFSGRDIAVAESFRDQALIAIQNARLFNETKEALERQTATADILRIISRSVAHAAPVFDTILESCQRLFSPYDAAVYLVEGDRVRGVARRGAGVGDWGADSMPLAGSSTCVAIAQRRPVHFPDLADKADLPEDKRAAVKEAGGMTVLYAPIISESRGVGSLVVTRRPKKPFTETEIEFIQSFADQAAIAIENARLFNETKAALEQQTATAEILSVMSSSPTDVTPVFEAIAERARELSGSRIGSAVRFDGELLHMIAFRGSSPEAEAAMHAAFPMKPGNGSLNARVIAGLVPLQIPDIDLDPAYQLGDVAKKGDYRALLAVPMIHDGRAIGAIGVGRDEPGLFPEKIVTLLQTFASQAVIAIENVRLFNETREALEQQTATADVLKVISRSAFDLDSVMHALARSAAELCAAGLCGLYIREGDFLVCRGYTAISKVQEDFVRQARIPAYDRNFATTRVLSSGEIANIGDFKNDRSVATQAFREKLGFESLLIVPLMREGQGIGLFVLGRDRVGQFSPRHVELVQTFADQAVIAIENSRLFDEVQARTSDLSEALEQQTATSAVLAVISRSPSDLNPVLEAISDTAARLCGSEQTMFFRYDGNVFRILASWNFPPEVHEMLERRPLMPGHPSAIGRAGASLKPVCIPDVLADPAYGLTGEQSRARYRATLAVPLLREGRLIGALSLNRSEPGAFTEKQIELVATFADQAVIAIENVRLFDEVQAKTSDLEESLQQQIATADVLKVISRSAFDLQTVLETLARSAVELSSARRGTVFLRNGDVFRFRAASHPDLKEEWIRFMNDNPQRAGRHSTIGRAIASARSVCTPDVDADPEIRMPTYLAGIRAVLAVPLLRDGKVEGVMALSRQEPGEFTARQIELVETFADQAVIAIENTRLFNETKQALAYQTGSSNVLRVIASSPTDVEPVLKEIVESARELCEANDAVVLLKDAEHLRFSAHSGPIPVTLDKWPIGRDWTAGRAFVDQKPVHVHDMLSGDGAEFPDARAMGQSTGATIRTVLSVPLLRGNESIGAILLRRTEVRPFNDKQINLLSTFADQAVIAIQNARLFRDTQEALERQTATSEILRVISQSPTEVQPVFDAIVETAVRLTRCDIVFVFRCDGTTFSPAAAAGAEGPLLDLGPSHLPIDPAANFPSRAIVGKKNVHLPDWSLIDLPEHERQIRALIGVNSGLFLPLLRDGECIGVLGLAGKRANIFGESEIALAESFRDQAVIAIENVRLFNETREALERQTATAEILKVIASSPDDVQPVFQAIAERSNHLVSGFATIVVSIIDDVVHLSAFTSTTPAADAALRAFYPRPLSGFSYSDAIRRGEIHRIVDAEAELAGEPEQLTIVRQRGWRSALWVPLLLEGKAIGVIGVTRVEPGSFADHHVDMLKTFADQAVIAISNVKLFKQVQERTRELSQSLDELRTAQDRLVQTEKLASLGQLTAGIAHEIKNPLNFVNNFSALSVELIDEMTDVFENSALDDIGRRKELDEIRELLKSNLEKVVQHGKRADSIVKNMLLHSREGSGERRAVDINALLDESLNLAYHGARAEKPDFNITLQRDLDPDAGVIELFPQEITRALLNLISNGFYAASKREAENGEADFEPVLSAATKNLGNHIEICIRDNGTGIPPEVKEKMFNPFFTTKPAGEGTGLGLSMSHDIIVKQHGGRLEVDTHPGQFTEFTIVLPRAANPASGRKS